LPGLVILPAARADLIGISDFIALDNPERALSFLSELERIMQTAAVRPGSFQHATISIPDYGWPGMAAT
jgi:toxin ParE1/3/4